MRAEPATGETTRRWAVLLGAILCAMAAAGLIWASVQSRPHSLTVGAYGDWQALEGFYRPEQNGAGKLFRWSAGQARIELPAPGERGQRIIRLRLDGGRPAGQPVPRVRVVAGEQQIAFAVASGEREYAFLSRPDAATKPFGITLYSDTFRPAGRPDELGVMLLEAWSAPLRPARGLGWLGFGLALVAAVGAGSWRRQFGARAAPRRLQWIALLFAVALFGFGLRAYGLNWDDGAGFHVDEQVLNRAALELKPPYNPKFFAYGSLPIYLYRATAALLSLADPRWLDPRVFPLIGRAFSVLASTLTIVLTALLGERLGGRRLGLLAALLLACTVLAIQAAHFGTTDSLVTLVAVALAWTSLNILEHGRRRDYVLSGVLIGIGVAIKITVLTLGLLPAIAVLLRWRAERIRLGALGRNLGAGVIGALGACALGAPYYFLDARSWLKAMEIEWSDAASGSADYTRQFIGTRPYLYVVENFPWTLGWPLTVAALAGVLLVAVAAARRRQSLLAQRWIVVIGWALGYFIFFGRFHDKYIRYTLPLTPVLALCAARALLWPASLRYGRLAGGALDCAVVGWTAIYALAFTDGVYGRPDARLLANHWLATHVPHGTTITREQYDVHLPVRVTTDRSLGGAPWYRVEALQWYAPDSPAKARTIARQLGAARYMVIASRSVYRPSLDHPDLFPMNARFFRHVFDGASGLREVARWQPMPRLGPLRWPRPAPEETFEVFDHPTVIIYERTPAFDARALEELLWQGAAR